MTTSLDGTIAYDWLAHFTQRFNEAEPRLTELDRLAGDGDFGTNIASALGRVTAGLPDKDAATFGSVFNATSRGFLATGGTSGPLFGMWFREISRAGGDTATVAELSKGVASGLAAIQKLGGAKVGDNTMIDALSPASTALTEAGTRGDSLLGALEAAATAARNGALSTKELIAARGRASYVGELARGVLDPGAVTIALFFEAGAQAAGAPDAWVPLSLVPALG